MLGSFLDLHFALFRMVYNYANKLIVKYKLRNNKPIPTYSRDEILRCLLSLNCVVSNSTPNKNNIWEFTFTMRYKKSMSHMSGVKIHRNNKTWFLWLNGNESEFTDFSTRYNIIVPTSLITTISNFVTRDYTNFKSRIDGDIIFRNKWQYLVNKIRTEVDTDSFFVELCDDYNITINERIHVKYFTKPKAYHMNYILKIPSTVIDYSFSTGYGSSVSAFTVYSDAHSKLMDDINSIYQRCKIRGIGMMYRRTRDVLDIVFTIPEEITGHTYKDLFIDKTHDNEFTNLTHENTKRAL